MEHNANIEISWADLAAVDWNGSSFPMNELIQSLSIKTEQTYPHHKSSIKAMKHKLSLA